MREFTNVSADISRQALAYTFAFQNLAFLLPFMPKPAALHNPVTVTSSSLHVLSSNAAFTKQKRTKELTQRQSCTHAHHTYGEVAHTMEWQNNQ